MVTLTGTQYSEDFDGIGSGLPLGWLIYTGATNSSLGNSATWTQATATWGETNGRFKNFAANDSGLASNASDIVQNSATDRALGIRQTTGFGDPGASFVFNLDNTLGFQNFGLSFKAQMLSVQPRSTTWSVDYRVGNSGNFNVLETYSDPNAFGSSTLNLLNFGTDINNQSNQVQIRISALSVSTGSSNRDSFGIDDFQLTYSSVPPSNPPVVTLPGTAISYTENASATILDASATVTDIDSPNFNNGSLTVRFTTGGSADDRINIRNEGTGATQINLDGREIYYGSNLIGNFIGGIGTESLVISLNTNATPERVQALLRNITYVNVSQNPSTSNRTVEVVLNDGNNGISTAITKTIAVAKVNDAPLIGGTTVLYDGSLGGTPDNQNKGLTYYGPGITPTYSSGVTNLNTLGNNSFQAGFSNYSTSGTNLTSFTLDRTTGYTISFSAKVTDEARAATANKNNDGKDDRAGFSVIAISSDGKFGIELGFWKDRIWAQDDGTTQKNPSLEPDAAPTSNFRTLFTQAEGVGFTTTSLVNYDLTVLGDTYTLFADSNAILSGKLRDYSAFTHPVLPVLDVYEKPNFIFFGDNTPSARANIDLNRVAVTTNSIPNLTIDEDSITGPIPFKIRDFETVANSLTVNFSSSNTALVPNNNISYSVTEVNPTRTFTVVPAANQNGTATITLSVSDGITTTQRTFDITVNPVNDRPTFTIGNNQSVKAGAGQQAIAGWASGFYSGADNESGQGIKNYIVDFVNSSDSQFFDGTPTIDSSTINPLTGDLKYTPTSNTSITSTTVKFKVQVQDNGGTANGGVDISTVQTFTITVNPTATNSMNGTPNADTNLMGTDQSDRISGLDNDDTIFGGLGSDRIFGNNGNDTLYGDLETIPTYGVNFTIDDTIAGGLGSDRIYGNGGNDKLYGDEGDDQIWGGDGNDEIWGGYGNDILNGGLGKDAFVLVRGQGADIIMDFTSEDVLGCAGALKYSSLIFTKQNGDTLITDISTNQLLATLKNFTGTPNNGGQF
jgi:Ca2+-binding RTX toxin-like protein